MPPSGTGTGGARVAPQHRALKGTLDINGQFVVASSEETGQTRCVRETALSTKHSMSPMVDQSDVGGAGTRPSGDQEFISLHCNCTRMTIADKLRTASIDTGLMCTFQLSISRKPGILRISALRMLRPYLVNIHWLLYSHPKRSS